MASPDEPFSMIKRCPSPYRPTPPRRIRDHPLRALLAMTGGAVLGDLPGVSIGSPVTDNFLAKEADGGLDYSVVPGMRFQAPGLNAWVNIAY